MKRDRKFTQDRGSWFATVEGFENKLGVHTTDRWDRARGAVRLFTEDPDDDTATRVRQVESARRDGAIALREYHSETNTAGRKVGVFRGEVRTIDGQPWFFIEERLHT